MLKLVHIIPHATLRTPYPKRPLTTRRHTFPVTSLNISLRRTSALSACLFASISLERLYRSSRNLLCMSAGAVARSSSGGVTICYVLPVLWMTSGFALNGPYGRFLSKCDNWNYLSYEAEILTRYSFLNALHWNI